MLTTGDIIPTSSRLFLISQLILGNAILYSILGHYCLVSYDVKKNNNYGLRKCGKKNWLK